MSDLVTERATADDVAALRVRIAGIAALVGAALIIVVYALLGEVPRTEYPAVLAHINDRPWFLMRLAGILAMLCWLVAFTTVGHILRAPLGRAIAQSAAPILTVAAAVFAIDYAHDGLGIGVLAERWADGELPTPEAISDARILELLIGGTSMLAQTLLGLGLAVFAIALLASREFSRVLCWLGLVGGLGWFLGGAALVARVGGLQFEVVLPFIGLATVWVVGVGVTLLRRGFRTRSAL